MVSAVGRSEERRGGGGRKIDISGGKARQEERVCITCSFHTVSFLALFSTVNPSRRNLDRRIALASQNPWIEFVSQNER